MGLENPAELSQVLACGEASCPAREAAPLQLALEHPTFGLLAPVRGQWHLEAERAEWWLQRGQVAWIAAHVGYRFSGMPAAQRPEALLVRVPGSDLEQRSFPKEAPSVVVASIPSLVLRLAVNVAAVVKDQKSRSRSTLLSAAAKYVFTLLWDSSAVEGQRLSSRRPAVPRNSHPLVRQAVRIMGEGGYKLRPGELAERMHVSYNHLARVFRHDTGMTLVEFRNEALLEAVLSGYNGRQTLLDAALEAGFGSYNQFYRVFRERFGSSPRQLQADPCPDLHGQNSHEHC